MLQFYSPFSSEMFLLVLWIFTMEINSPNNPNVGVTILQILLVFEKTPEFIKFYRCIRTADEAFQYVCLIHIYVRFGWRERRTQLKTFLSNYIINNNMPNSLKEKPKFQYGGKYVHWPPHINTVTCATWTKKTQMFPTVWHGIVYGHKEKHWG